MLLAYTVISEGFHVCLLNVASVPAALPSRFRVFCLMMMAASHAEEPKQHAFHDIYKELNENGRYRNEGGVGLQCCGGDPYDGDCEPVGSNYAILPNGDAVFASRRYSANVLVARDKIMWMSIRGGESRRRTGAVDCGLSLCRRNAEYSFLRNSIQILASIPIARQSRPTGTEFKANGLLLSGSGTSLTKKRLLTGR